MQGKAAPASISLQVARRYLLGRQGLWPGRRWAGKEGAAEAIRSLGSVQVDPMTVVARSHDLVLWSRVDGYDCSHLDELIYRDRRFFEYGGILSIYPIEELPYWRVHMRRRALEPRQATFAAANPALLDEVRAVLREQGPSGTRDLAGGVRVNSYRASKDTGLALYNLWLTGELVIHGRRGSNRIYDFWERAASLHAGREATEDEAERFFARKALRRHGLGTATAWANGYAYLIARKVDRTERRDRISQLVEEGEARVVSVEGQKQPYYYPAADAPLLANLQSGEVPEEWRALGSTTGDEVILLAPLDGLLNRDRIRRLFDFEYLWEIYKPPALRRWGYYTMPILYKDRLVGRLDPRLDRKTGTLRINGFWLEDAATASDPAFAEAFARGLSRFARFHAARQLELSAVEPSSLRERVRASVIL